MGFLLDKCRLVKVDAKILDSCYPFTCGDDDLDDFFLNDAMRYKEELLGKTYCFVLDDDPRKIVCMFTLSNLIVDAYNKEIPLAFYQKNDFLFLFSSEQQEAENLGYDLSKLLHTRLMYFDLKNLTSSDVY